MKIIIIGIQGSGKSTQGNLLSEKLHIPYLSTGNIFRILSQEHTPLGQYIKKLTSAGYLVPDHKTLTIVTEYLHHSEYADGFILDGFPRTVKQAEQFKNHIDYVFYLRVSDKEALWRLAGRENEGETRNDVTLKAILKRIELFHTHTEPVIEFYKKQHKLHEIDGEQSIEHIHKEILSKIKK